MSTEMNLFKRLTSPTPAFFIKVRKIALTISALGTSILTGSSLITGFTLPEFLKTIATYCIVGGFVMAATASAATTNTIEETPVAPVVN